MGKAWCFLQHIFDDWESHLSGCFRLLPENFGRWQGPASDTLSSYECRLSDGDTQMWW